MRIKTAKQDLEAALQVVNSGLGSGGADDVQTHFVFRVVQNDKGEWKSQVLTYNNRLCAGSFFVSQIDRSDTDPVGFTIEGYRLKELLKPLPDAVITLDFNGTTTTYEGPNGDRSMNVQFQSLDPKKYPYWDDSVATTKLVATVPAPALRKAFNWARLFVLEEAGRRPDLSVFECRNGTIYSTNTKTVALVKVPGLDTSTLRVHGADASKILSFLDSVGDEDVDILESDSALYFRRKDGAVFGESRFTVRFPDNLKMGQIDVDPIWWDLPVADLKNSLQIMNAVITKDDIRLRIKDGPGDAVTMEMLLASGTGNVSQVLPKKSSGMEAGAPAIPVKGFQIDRSELKLLLSVHEGETIRMGVHPRGKGGFVRFTASSDGVDCQVILAWLRE